MPGVLEVAVKHGCRDGRIRCAGKCEERSVGSFGYARVATKMRKGDERRKVMDSTIYKSWIRKFLVHRWIRQESSLALFTNSACLQGLFLLTSRSLRGSIYRRKKANVRVRFWLARAAVATLGFSALTTHLAARTLAPTTNV